MAEIKSINLNKVELKLADIDDPVALKLDWNPLNPGGSNFKTHELVVTQDVVTVKNSISLLFMASFFAIFGIIALAFSATEFLSPSGRVGLALFLSVFGSIFILVSALIAFGTKPLTFNKKIGFYYRGKDFKKEVSASRNSQGFLSEVYAIQIISELIQSNSKNGSSTYRSYEINLVFKDGFRVNVLDHGNLASIQKSAQELGQFLAIPIWQASY